MHAHMECWWEIITAASIEMYLPCGWLQNFMSQLCKPNKKFKHRVEYIHSPMWKRSKVLIFVEKLVVIGFFIHQNLSWNFQLWIEEFKGWWFRSLLYTTNFSRRFWNPKREAYGTCCFSVWSYCVSGLSRSAVITLELISLDCSVEGQKQIYIHQKLLPAISYFSLCFVLDNM